MSVWFFLDMHDVFKNCWEPDGMGGHLLKSVLHRQAGVLYDKQSFSYQMLIAKSMNSLDKVITQRALSGNAKETVTTLKRAIPHALDWLQRNPDNSPTAPSGRNRDDYAECADPNLPRG